MKQHPWFCANFNVARADFSQSQQERIQGLFTERLEELWDVLFDFNSITDLKNWLARI